MLNFYQNWNSIMNVGVLGIDGGNVSGGVMVVQLHQQFYAFYSLQRRQHEIHCEFIKFTT